MFCKMIAKDFKKLEGKWTYKVFMVGGAVFYEAPCKKYQKSVSLHAISSYKKHCKI